MTERYNQHNNMQLDHYKDTNWKTILALVIAGPPVLCLGILLTPLTLIAMLVLYIVAVVTRCIERKKDQK